MAIRRIKIQTLFATKLSANAMAIVNLESALALPAPDSTDYAAILAAAVNAPVLSRHIAEAIGYRNLDRSDYGNVF